MRLLSVQIAAALTCLAAPPELTVYNQGFAIVRQTVPLRLQAGETRIEWSDVTSSVEPESVILRDPAGRANFTILEQSYRADPIALGAMLEAYEGKAIEFQIVNNGRTEVVPGTIVRAGTMHRQGSGLMRWFNTAAYAQQPMSASVPPSPPIIEIGGKLRFDLPGVPLFPGLGSSAQLKPALGWVIGSTAAANLDAELSYSSGGFNWGADYNIVQAAGNSLDITGYVTVENRSGRAFEDARIKLMAGDVNKVRPQVVAGTGGGVIGGIVGGVPGLPPVAEKSFDEYHLYTLGRPVTLHDRESKQVEFVKAQGFSSDVVYVYDGALVDWNRYRGAPAEMLRQDSGFGAQSQNKVLAMREFVNSKANRLGMPLPKGRVRFYRRDTDGRLEFTGEDTIDHTPENERIRVFTGAAFDLTGERRRTSFRIDHGRQSADESFEIKVRNHKREPVTVRVVEHMYRWSGWEIPVTSQPFRKTESQTVEFDVPLGPDQEKTVTYAVHYQW